MQQQDLEFRENLHFHVRRETIISVVKINMQKYFHLNCKQCSNCVTMTALNRTCKLDKTTILEDVVKFFLFNNIKPYRYVSKPVGVTQALLPVGLDQSFCRKSSKCVDVCSPCSIDWIF